MRQFTPTTDIIIDIISVAHFCQHGSTRELRVIVMVPSLAHHAKVVIDMVVCVVKGQVLRGEQITSSCEQLGRRKTCTRLFRVSTIPGLCFNMMTIGDG
jgi:hypothetical protein